MTTGEASRHDSSSFGRVGASNAGRLHLMPGVWAGWRAAWVALAGALDTPALAAYTTEFLDGLESPQWGGTMVDEIPEMNYARRSMLAAEFARGACGKI
jgi:hypothetical protein